MRTLRPPVLFALALIALTSCRPAAGTTPPGPGATPTPTPILAGREGSSAILVYEYVLTSDDLLYETRVSEELPVLFFIDTADPRAGTIVAGGKTGIERVRIAGLNGGVACWAELTYTVQFDIVGSFDPAADCALTLRVQAIPDHGKTVRGGDCPAEGINLLAPEMLFIAPYEGPFEFARPYETITIDFSGGSYAVAGLKDVRLPAATGCP